MSRVFNMEKYNDIKAVRDDKYALVAYMQQEKDLWLYKKEYLSAVHYKFRLTYWFMEDFESIALKDTEESKLLHFICNLVKSEYTGFQYPSGFAKEYFPIIYKQFVEWRALNNNQMLTTLIAEMNGLQMAAKLAVFRANENDFKNYVDEITLLHLASFVDLQRYSLYDQQLWNDILWEFDSNGIYHNYNQNLFLVV